MGSLSFLQGIFPVQASNTGLPHCERIFYQLSHKGSPTTGSLTTGIYFSGFWRLEICGQGAGTWGSCPASWCMMTTCIFVCPASAGVPCGVFFSHAKHVGFLGHQIHVVFSTLILQFSNPSRVSNSDTVYRVSGDPVGSGLSPTRPPPPQMPVTGIRGHLLTDWL